MSEGDKGWMTAVESARRRGAPLYFVYYQDVLFDVTTTEDGARRAREECRDQLYAKVYKRTGQYMVRV